LIIFFLSFLIILLLTGLLLGPNADYIHLADT
jgi:hypothetical protein